MGSNRDSGVRKMTQRLCLSGKTPDKWHGCLSAEAALSDQSSGYWWESGQVKGVLTQLGEIEKPSFPLNQWDDTQMYLSPKALL